MMMVYAFWRLRSKRDPWELMAVDVFTPGDAPEAAGKKARKSSLSESLDKRLSGSTFAEKTATRLSQADVRLTPGEFLAARLGAAALGAIAGLILGGAVGAPPMLGAAVVAGVGFKVPAFIVSFRRKKRVSKYNEQLSDTTMMMANSLRAGYSLSQSMDLMSRDAPQPTTTEFRRIVQEVGVGLTLNQALNNMLRRVPSSDLDLLITAIAVQQEVGGNLSQVLEGISTTIRERVRIKGEIRVLTSQGRISGHIITALPFLLAALITVINPDYMTPMFSFPWIVMPIISLVLIGFAFLIIRKIVNIEV